MHADIQGLASGPEMVTSGGKADKMLGLDRSWLIFSILTNSLSGD
jgi:hypothetical protein